MPAGVKDLLLDETTCASVLMEATRRVVGNYLAWEPESIWEDLFRRGIDLPVANRDKLMAAITLRLVPSFYWDAVVFEKTALALDDRPINPGALEEATPAQLAWAVVEADVIRKLGQASAHEFQHEPRAYAGVVLQRAGFVLAPAELDFAQPALNRERNCVECPLLTDVRTRWRGAAHENLAVAAYPETPVGVQLARLASVALHVTHKRALLQRQLAALD